MTSREISSATLERIGVPLRTPAARALAERVARVERAALAAHPAPRTPRAPRTPSTPRAAEHPARLTPRRVPNVYRPSIVARVLMAAAPRALRS